MSAPQTALPERGKTTPASNAGSFAAYAHGAGDVTLVDEPRQDHLVSTPTRQTRRFKAVETAVEQMMPYATGAGVMPARERQEDVEKRLRALCRHVPEAEFAEHMAAIGRQAEIVGILEHTHDDPFNTEVWEAYAEEADIREDDYPASAEDWAPGDDGTDWAAMARATREEWEARLRASEIALTESEMRHAAAARA